MLDTLCIALMIYEAAHGNWPLFAVATVARYALLSHTDTDTD